MTSLKVKLHKYSNIQSLYLIKFTRPLAIIVYYTVQFDVVCCKSFILDMGPNTIFLIKKYISNDSLKLQLKISQHTILHKIW